MTKTPLELVFYGSDTALLAELKALSTNMPYVSYEIGTGTEVTARAKLDALWASLMAAVELFGLNPPFPLHEAIVLRTPKKQVEHGFPRYGVAGVAASPDDPKTPEYCLRLKVGALLRAVQDFNSEHDNQIARIGILPEDLLLQKLRPQSALGIIREAYEEVG
jgi:hypothetical protein